MLFVGFSNPKEHGNAICPMQYFLNTEDCDSGNHLPSCCTHSHLNSKKENDILFHGNYSSSSIKDCNSVSVFPRLENKKGKHYNRWKGRFEWCPLKYKTRRHSSPVGVSGALINSRPAIKSKISHPNEAVTFWSLISREWIPIKWPWWAMIWDWFVHN